MIVDIVYPEFCADDPSASPRCAVGMQVAPGAFCEIDCLGPPSDYRLKRDITLLTQLDNGIKLYSFRYLWSDETYVGVMAQDLLQDSAYKNAVVLMDTNFYAVNYQRLGLQMITLDQWTQSSQNIFYSSDI
jgi:hypothetical protein